MNKKYKCKKCGTFLGELKENGYIEYNSKCKFASNGIIKKITCKCGEVTIIKD